MSTRKLVYGLGSSHGDDRAGWDVVCGLREKLSREATNTGEIVLREIVDPLVVLEGEPAAHWVVIDAARSGRVPGRVWRREWNREMSREARTWFASHRVPLGDVLQVAASLGRIPPRVTLWGIEIRDDDCRAFGSMTERTKVATEQAVGRIARWLGAGRTIPSAMKAAGMGSQLP
ncbi:MAG: hydrogenase maturation protease [Pirellulaceae bacterium]|nr:hydrogenase maturation protease [Planctomycetales bacterium]MCA9265191.1 hydrogenase maturation protease [Planctomycetales bacterium]